MTKNEVSTYFCLLRKSQSLIMQFTVASVDIWCTFEPSLMPTFLQRTPCPFKLRTVQLSFMNVTAGERGKTALYHQICPKKLISKEGRASATMFLINLTVKE